MGSRTGVGVQRRDARCPRVASCCSRLVVLAAGCGASAKHAVTSARRPVSKRNPVARRSRPVDGRRACTRAPRRARPGCDLGAMARRRDPGRRPDGRRHLDLERRARPRTPAARRRCRSPCTTPRLARARRRRLPVRRRRRGASARRDHPGHAGRAERRSAACRRRARTRREPPGGGAEYVVGGYTGTSWLNTIVRWRPGQQARIVGHLPVPLRYAAVAAVPGRIVIAGGSTPAGTASDAVLSFDPATGRVTRIGRLPSPTTHAAAAALGGHVYVIGGRSATVDTPTAAIEAIDPIARKVVAAGTLTRPAPTSRPSACRGRSCSPAAGAARARSRPSPSFCRRAAEGEDDGGRAQARRCAQRLCRRPSGKPDGRRAHRAAAGLRAELAVEHGGRDRSALVQGRRPLRGRRAPAACRPRLRPEAPLRHERHGQHAHPARSADGQADADDPGRRPVQHVLHARRALRDRRRRAQRAARLPRRAHVRARQVGLDSMSRRRPHGLHRRRDEGARQLRVLGPVARARRGRSSASSRSSAPGAGSACLRT